MSAEPEVNLVSCLVLLFLYSLWRRAPL